LPNSSGKLESLPPREKPPRQMLAYLHRWRCTFSAEAG
jgi:hypothetical protein